MSLLKPFPAVRGPFPTLTSEGDPAGKVGIDLRVASLETALRQWVAYLGKVPNALNAQEGTVLGEVFARLSALEEFRNDREKSSSDLMKCKEPWQRVFWIVATVALSVITTGILGSFGSGFLAIGGRKTLWYAPAHEHRKKFGSSRI